MKRVLNIRDSFHSKKYNRFFFLISAKVLHFSFKSFAEKG